MEKQSWKFNKTLSLDTLLVLLGLGVSTGILLQKVTNLEQEQSSIQERIAKLDEKNSDEHKDIVKTLAGTASLINFHLKNEK